MRGKIAGNIAALAALALAVVATRLGAQEQSLPVSSQCTAAQYRQFDFWIGDWDVIDRDTKSTVARATISAILGGCVLLEEYRGLKGHDGRSFSGYDAPRGLWHQTWVTNSGNYLAIEGTFHDHMMVLSGAEILTGGAQRLVRGTWEATADGVHEVAVRSTDGGKSWTNWFDIEFVRRARICSSMFALMTGSCNALF